MYISDFLKIKGKKTVISISGGGGKTSTLFRLAYELKDYKVLITTTTKILKPEISDDYDIIIEKNSEKFLKEIHQHKNHIICGSSMPEGTRKFIGCAIPFLKDIKDHFDFVLIEADGSAGRPVKAPATHEPVIADFTDIYIGVLGLDCLGKRADSQNVHRPEIFSQIRQKPPEQRIKVEDLVKLINSPDGLFKNAPENCQKVVLLNKADLITEEQGREIVSSLRTEIIFPVKIILNSFKKKQSVQLLK